MYSEEEPPVPSKWSPEEEQSGKAGVSLALTSGDLQMKGLSEAPTATFEPSKTKGEIRPLEEDSREASSGEDPSKTAPKTKKAGSETEEVVGP